MHIDQDTLCSFGIRSVPFRRRRVTHYTLFGNVTTRKITSPTLEDRHCGSVCACQWGKTTLVVVLLYHHSHHSHRPPHHQYWLTTTPSRLCGVTLGAGIEAMGTVLERQGFSELPCHRLCPAPFERKITIRFKSTP
mmetsp:Transcript_32599/g.36605  ORF Transcript_32599/g.36605 Transcript_32599/m.36605 type:complete len:136 (+) Transcript_32599:154-561(+)